MARQRQRRTDPAIRAAELAADRERWPKRRDKRCAQMRAWLNKNYATRYEKQKAYRARMIELVRKWCRDCYHRNPAKTLERERRGRETITKSYAACVLNIPVSAIPDDFMPLYRAHLQLKRELRRFKK